MTTATDDSASGADSVKTTNTHETNPRPSNSATANANERPNTDGAHLDTAAMEQLIHPQLSAIQSLLDELPRFNIDTTVELPQIIVVGEALSGKSSVLSALSRIVLPLGVTRFATEIILRPAKKWETRIATWEPYEDGDSEQFKWADIEHQQPLGNDFTEVTQKAHDSISKYSDGDERYSDKVLRIEIQGPDLQPLKLVDLPGVFACPRDGKPTKDQMIANKVVESYMRKRNSIILVVVEAFDFMYTSAALSKARQLDPDGERTIGVLVGPEKADNEDSLLCIRMINDQDSEYHLRHGWHVLRNQESDDSDATDFDGRDEAETAFFNELPWNFVLETDTGIANLRTKLKSLMYNNMRRDIPDLVNRMKIKLTERQERLRLCGAERSNIKEMRSFLLGIASGFQRLARDAISGNYAHAFFGELDEPKNRLRTELGALHQAFRYVMATKGCQYSFPTSADEYTDPNGQEERKQADLLAETVGKYPYNLESPPVKSRQEIYTRLETLAAIDECKGLPGSCNSDLAIQLFQELSKPWAAIAERHVAHVVSVVRSFAGSLLLYLIGGESASAELSDFVMRKVDDFFGRQEVVLADKINELLEPYAEGYNLPPNASFRRYLTKYREWRETTQTKPMSTICPSNKDPSGDRPTQDAQPTGIAELGPFGIKATVEMAEIYYLACCCGFTDNITNLAIERCLVRRLPGIVTPSDVGNLDNKELGQYAAETAAQLAKRKQLNLEIDMLQRGLEKCRKWRPLEASVVRSQGAKNAVHAADSAPKSIPSTSATALSTTTCNNGSLADITSTTSDKEPSSGPVNQDSTDPPQTSKSLVNSMPPPQRTLIPSTPKTSPASALSSSKTGEDLFSNSTPAKRTVTPGTPATSTTSTPLPSSKSTECHTFAKPKKEISAPSNSEPVNGLLCGSTFTGGVFDPSKAPITSSIFAGRSPPPKVS